MKILFELEENEEFTALRIAEALEVQLTHDKIRQVIAFLKVLLGDIT